MGVERSALHYVKWTHGVKEPVGVPNRMDPEYEELDEAIT